MMKIKFDLFVNNYNGGPKIRVYNNDQVVLQKVLTGFGHQTLELEADLKCPTKLTIEHYDKNMKRDTKLEDGKIVSDKGFTLEKIHMDNFVLENELYHFNFIKEDGGEIANNNYIGFNGKYVIDIDSEDLLTWYYKLQKIFINDKHTFDYDQFKEEIFKGEHCEVEY